VCVCVCVCVCVHSESGSIDTLWHLLFFLVITVLLSVVA